jgi:hypothetical protein
VAHTIVGAGATVHYGNVVGSLIGDGAVVKGDLTGMVVTRDEAAKAR